MESPESWFEDFGKVTLDECGHAEVTIDPDFAAVADLSDYHVFLTAYERSHLLYVNRQTPRGFSVDAVPVSAAANREPDSTVAGTFSWRVVAKRKDIKGERLATVTIPPEPTLPPVPPDVATPPPPPASDRLENLNTQPARHRAYRSEPPDRR
jgi:hypothetical protein